MIKPLLCAALALAGVPALAAASPTPKACPHTDPRGDVRLDDLVTVDAPHLDILSYSVTVGATEMVAVIRTAGSGDGRWSIEATSGKRRYWLSATRGIAPVDDPRTSDDETGVAFSAWSYPAAGGTVVTVPARGTVAGGEVRIRVRLKDFGAHAPRRGAALREFWARARQRLVTVPGTSAGEYSDHAGSAC